MKLLLDAHTLIWAVDSPSQLSAPARAALQTPAHELSLSAATLWEIAIKVGLGKLKLAASLELIAAALLALLVLWVSHAGWRHVAAKKRCQMRLAEQQRPLTAAERSEAENLLKELRADERQLLQQMVSSRVPYILLRPESQEKYRRLIDNRVLVAKGQPWSPGDRMTLPYELNPLLWKLLMGLTKNF